MRLSLTPLKDPDIKGKKPLLWKVIENFDIRVYFYCFKTFLYIWFEYFCSLFLIFYSVLHFLCSFLLFELTYVMSLYFLSSTIRTALLLFHLYHPTINHYCLYFSRWLDCERFFCLFHCFFFSFSFFLNTILTIVLPISFCSHITHFY